MAGRRCWDCWNLQGHFQPFAREKLRYSYRQPGSDFPSYPCSPCSREGLMTRPQAETTKSPGNLGLSLNGRFEGLILSQHPPSELSSSWRCAHGGACQIWGGFGGFVPGCSARSSVQCDVLGAKASMAAVRKNAAAKDFGRRISKPVALEGRAGVPEGLLDPEVEPRPEPSIGRASASQTRAGAPR